jgi:hypothetical protein
MLKKLKASIVDRLPLKASGVRLDARTLASRKTVARINSLETGIARSHMNLFMAECHNQDILIFHPG